MDKPTKTPFELAQEEAIKGNLQVPSVTLAGKQINYFWYQLATCKFNLGLLSKGMQFKNVRLKDLKWYYGLKSKSAKDCLAEFLVIMEDYKIKHNIKSQPNEQATDHI